VPVTWRKVCAAAGGGGGGGGAAAAGGGGGSEILLIGCTISAGFNSAERSVKFRFNSAERSVKFRNFTLERLRRLRRRLEVLAAAEEDAELIRLFRDFAAAAGERPSLRGGLVDCTVYILYKCLLYFVFCLRLWRLFHLMVDTVE
jgi:hypothetical protein